MRSASRKPNIRFVDGVYAKNPSAFAAIIGPQDQYDFVRVAVREAASAFWLIELKAMPGGSINPFCDPATTTSMPHSS